MELAIVGSGEKLAVSETIFGRDFREDLVHQVVVAYRNAGRSGTKAQLTRAEVKATTKKSRPQKGTGGARHGALSAPIFTGGGVTFAAKPRSFAQKVNRKMYRGAISSILSELLRQDRVLVVENFIVDEPKTQALVEKLDALGVKHPLIVTEDGSDALYLAARNIPYVEVRDVQGLDPVILVGARSVVMTIDAIKKIEEWLA